jgi:hypothetical protein
MLVISGRCRRAGSVLLTGILAGLIGHDSAAEHGDPVPHTVSSARQEIG